MKNKKNWIVILVLIILLLLLFILYLLFGRSSSYTITFDTNGGTEISNIEVKNNEIVKLPDAPTKEGYQFVGWTNEEGKIITKGTRVEKDITLKAEWVSDDALVVVADFDTAGGNEIDNIIIEKGKVMLWPVDPRKDGYVFAGWMNGDGNYIFSDEVVTDNISLKAIWIKKNAKTSMVTFEVDGSNLGSITTEKGKTVLLPTTPTKEGYVFAGWALEDGNVIDSDYVVNKNITVKATWKEPFTCPSNCTPIEDGSKCRIETTKEMTTSTACPSGYTSKNGLCLDMSSKYHAESVQKADGTWGWGCNNSNEYMYSEIDSSGMGAFMWCVKTGNKVTISSCPSGYTQSGNICKATEIVPCIAN